MKTKQKYFLILLTFLIPTISFTQNDSIYVKSARIKLDSISLEKRDSEIQKEWQSYNFSEKYPNYQADYVYEIIDKKSGMKFIVDSTEIYISAYNKKGNLIWKRDPWKEEELMLYRHNRPIIVEFSFDNIPSTSTSKKWLPSKEVIWIRYSNSQMGWLDKITGEYFHFGQD